MLRRGTVFGGGVAVFVLASASFGLDLAGTPIRLSQLASATMIAAMGLGLVGQSRGIRWLGGVAGGVVLATSVLLLWQAAAALARHDARRPDLVMGGVGAGQLAILAFCWIKTRSLNLWPPPTD